MSIPLACVAALCFAAAPPATNVPLASKLRVDSTLEVFHGAALYPSTTMLCGPALLYIACACMGTRQYALGEIASMAGWDLVQGTSFLGLETACKRMGLHANAFRLSVDRLKSLMTSNHAMAILQEDAHYYLILKTVDSSFLVVTTPQIEPYWVEADALREGWNGKALLLSDRPIKIPSDRRRLVTPLALAIFLIILAITVRYSLAKPTTVSKRNHHAYRL